MVQELTGRFVVVWDGGSMHKGDPIRALVDHFADRLALEKLPPYAPMLNPVESLWSWLKWERLSNFGPQDAHELDARVIAELTAVREDQAFLRNLFHASDLPLPRALLSCLSILPRATPELNAMDHLWRHTKRETVGSRATLSVEASALAACQYIIGLSPRDRLRQAGILSGNFWLTK